MLAATLLAAALMTQGDTGRRIAITFDDLPLSRAATPVAAQESLTVALVAALTAARVPAIGFVNEGKLRGDDRAVDPRRVALLTRWLDAGLELGNHTATHPDLHQVPLADVEADLLAGGGDPAAAARRARRHAPLLPSPLPAHRRSLAVRDALLAFLEAHGYEVAPVTMDNGDYLFARAYDLARDRGDRAAADRITAEYLAYLERVVVFWERQSVAITGREIPQVLLLHANALNARHLPPDRGAARRARLHRHPAGAGAGRPGVSFGRPLHRPRGHELAAPLGHHPRPPREYLPRGARGPGVGPGRGALAAHLSAEPSNRRTADPTSRCPCPSA
jgi:peptidoglycan/xylan/chitin deacetylase (PgdA/CDA1 family)